jgi:hypothetical protein
MPREQNNAHRKNLMMAKNILHQIKNIKELLILIGFFIAVIGLIKNKPQLLRLLNFKTF